MLVFYVGLFLRTMRMAHAEALKARAFVSAIPLHILDAKEANTIKDYFTSS